MKTGSDRFSVADEGSIVGDLVRATLLFLWGAVRALLLVILTFLEPFIRFILVGIALLTILTAFVFEGSSAPPVIPFWGMISIALGCVLAMALYQRVLRFLSR